MKYFNFFLALTCILTITYGESTAQKQPNVIYILADDLGFGDVSANNPAGKIRTPHIDALASDGMRFTDAHSGSAVCTPTRYGIMTGRYSWRGVLKKGVTWSYDSSIVETNRFTVADLFQQNGYTTACIGKWHLGLNWSKEDTTDYPVNFRKPVEKSPNSNGFDHSYIIPASLDIPPYVYLENGMATAQPNRQTEDKSEFGWWRLGPTGSDFVHENVLQRFADKTIEFINQQPTDKPFFIYMPLAAPHTPILPTEKWKGKSGLNDYADFVLMVDDVVGQIRNALKESGLDENTLIVFTSDNGCSPSAGAADMEVKGHFSSGPFRGYKADIFEGGHRVPFIVKWAEEIKAGSVSDETICLTDFMQTAASILDVELPESAAEDSYDLSKIWKNELAGTSLREVTIHHSVNGTFAIRQGDWKLILSPDSGGWSKPTPKSMEGQTGVQLYNLATDIGEKNNVAAENPEVVAQLKIALKNNIEAGRSTPGAKQAYVKSEGWEILQKLKP